MLHVKNLLGDIPGTVVYTDVVLVTLILADKMKEHLQNLDSVLTCFVNEEEIQC